jgi:hypothetical protein
VRQPSGGPPLTDPDNPTPAYAQDSTYVWNISIHYQIRDQLMTRMPSPVPINENWTTGVVADYQNENWRRGSAGCFTTLSQAPAAFFDFIQGETPDRTPTPVYNTQQNGAAVYHRGQEWRLGTCTIGSGPRVQTDTLQKYVDHAAHNRIFSPPL